MINVRDFGAKGDGSNPDTLAIQAAIDATDPNSASLLNADGIVFFPPGLYEIGNLTLPTGVNLIGSGPRGTVLRAIYGTSGALITDRGTEEGQGSTGIRIQDMDIRKRDDEDSAVLHGIVLGYQGEGNDQFNLGAIINHVHVWFFKHGYGIDLNCNVGELQDVYCNSCDIGMRLAGAVARASRLALQGSISRELQVNSKDTRLSDVHIETDLGSDKTAIAVSEPGKNVVINGLTVSVSKDVTLGTVLAISSGVTGCIVRDVAINLDAEDSDYTNLIYDNNSPAYAITKSELEDPYVHGEYYQAKVRSKRAVLGGIGTQLEDAATISVDACLGSVFWVTLAGNRTMEAPTYPTLGQRITLIVKQDATGSRTLAWNAIYKTNWSNSGNTANKQSTISFVYDGTNWVQDGAQSAYF